MGCIARLALSRLQGMFIESDRVDIHFFLRVAVHTSDVSNPARRSDYTAEWTARVVEEFYIQGDLEKAKGLSVSAFMDRCVHHAVVSHVVLSSVTITLHPQRLLHGHRLH